MISRLSFTMPCPTSDTIRHLNGHHISFCHKHTKVKLLDRPKSIRWLRQVNLRSNSCVSAYPAAHIRKLRSYRFLIKLYNKNLHQYYLTLTNNSRRDKFYLKIFDQSLFRYTNKNEISKFSETLRISLSICV
jgi:hypothetical protein